VKNYLTNFQKFPEDWNKFPEISCGTSVNFRTCKPTGISNIMARTGQYKIYNNDMAQ